MKKCEITWIFLVPGCAGVAGDKGEHLYRTQGKFAKRGFCCSATSTGLTGLWVEIRVGFK